MDKKYNKFFVFAALLAIFALAIFFRVFFDYKTVFSDPVKYSADDGVYHMRLVENELLGGHFPSIQYFDPFTNFPHGTYVYFAPMYSWFLAAIIWLISFGKPTLKIINLISPFYPAFLGGLLVFVVFFIAKALWKDSKIALLSALLAGISQPFLMRSLLGSTDHHVAEVLFSTLTMLFLILSLQSRKEKISENKQKKFWLFTFLTGVSLGLYFQVWTGALMFLLLIFSFIVLCYLIEYFFGNRKNWLLQMGIVIFLVSFLMIAPFLGHPSISKSLMYNTEHILAFSLGVLVFVILLLFDLLFVKKKINPKLMPVFLILSGVVLLLLSRIFLPGLFSQLEYGLSQINGGVVGNQAARDVISEMSSLNYAGFVGLFSSLFFVSIISLAIIFYRFIKNRKPEFLLLFLWTVFMMFMSGLVPYFGQNRFSCYLSPIFALLSGFLFVKGLQFGWHGVKSYERGDAEINISIRKRLLIGSVSIIFILLFLLFYPIPFNLGYGFPMGLPDFILIPVKTASSLFVFNQDVYDVMSWLRTDTPDPGVDYYGLYKEPPVNKTTGEIKDYAYPKQAYGILAEWGLGHTITYYSHRIPVANPFQQGVGKINKDGTIEPGQTTFFLQTDEKKATKMLDELRSPYVISDAGEANADHGFQQMIKWVQGNFDGYLVPGTKNIDMNKFLNSMIARLHLYNGSETISDVGSAGNIFVKSLDHFRLLYESKTTAFSLKNSVENDIKQYKVFEYVKGVQIAGKTVPGNQVEISADIKTNQGVDFVYKKTTTADNGSFDFVVPYSTGKQEKSDVSAGAYTIKIGNYTKSVKISEEDVLQGKVINL